MQGWLRSKLDHITAEFLGGGGYGAVYEAQFLAYLECLLVVFHQDVAPGNQSANFWEQFKEACVAATPEGKTPRNFTFYIEDRQELVDALRAFQKRFDLPSPSKFISPAAQNEPEASSGGEEAMDLFDLLGGD